MPQLEHGNTVEQRLALCRDLLKFQEQRTKTSKTMVKAVVARRIGAVRRNLTGRSEPGGALADELMSPSTALPRLKGMMDQAMAAEGVERTRSLLYVHGITETLRSLSASESSIGIHAVSGAALDELRQQAKDMLGGYTKTGENTLFDGVIEQSIGGGKISEEIREELAKLNEKKEDHRKAVQQDIIKTEVAINAAVDKANELYHKALGNDGFELSEAERLQAMNEYKRYRDEVIADLRVELQSKRLGLRRDMRDGDREAQAVAGRKIIAKLADASPITQEQADAWAAAQEITKQAKARLRKIGYMEPDVRRDMAEFYRMTGGRLNVVRIHSNGDRRANATDIEAHGKVGTINLDSSFDKRVLWHELGHHLEADPVAKAAAGRFIRRRSSDGKAYSLRSLTGNSGYHSSEVAYQGAFFHPYVGKIYSDGVTEVFSMGIETFSDPALLARRALDDPQTLEFVGGFLAAPMDDLAKAHMTMRDTLRELVEGANGEAAASRDQLIAQVANKVQFREDSSGSWIPQQLAWQFSRETPVGVISNPETGSEWGVLRGMFAPGYKQRRKTGFSLISLTGRGYHISASKEMDHAKVVAYYFDTTGLSHQVYLGMSEISEDKLRELAQ